MKRVIYWSPLIPVIGCFTPVIYLLYKDDNKMCFNRDPIYTLLYGLIQLASVLVLVMELKLYYYE